MTSAVSGKTSYLVVGDEPGESKIKKAKDKNVAQIDEDALLELIKTKPGKKSKYEIEAEKPAEKPKTPKKSSKSAKTPKKVAEKEKGKINIK